MTRILFVLTIAIPACATNGGDDSPPPCLDGKCDGASAPRTLTFGIDRRPVDGALDEIGLEPNGDGGFTVVHDHVYVSRGTGGSVLEREEIFDDAECEVSLTGVACSQEDQHLAIVNTPFGFEARTFDHAGDVVIAERMKLRHARFIDGRADDTRVELVVDGTGAASSYAASLRVTYDTGYAPDARVLVERATCIIDTGALRCSRDDRPVDGALVTLEVAPAETETGYTGTLETQYLAEEDYDHELLDDDLRLR